MKQGQGQAAPSRSASSKKPRELPPIPPNMPGALPFLYNGYLFFRQEAQDNPRPANQTTQAGSCLLF